MRANHVRRLATAALLLALTVVAGNPSARESGRGFAAEMVGEVTLQAGDFPLLLDVEEGLGRAYIWADGAQGLRIFDTTTKALIGSIPFPTSPPSHGWPLPPQPPYLYVPLHSQATTAIFAPGPDEFTDSWPIGWRPGDGFEGGWVQAFSSNGLYAFVTREDPPSLEVYDTPTRGLLAQKAVPPGPRVEAVSPDDSKLYVVTGADLDNGENENYIYLSVISAYTLQTVARYPLEVGGPGDVTPPVVMEPAADGERMLLITTGTDHLMAIDIATNALDENPPEGVDLYYPPWAMVLTPDRTKAYIITSLGSELPERSRLAIVDLVENRLLQLFNLPYDAHESDMDLDPTRNELWITFPKQDKVLIYDVSSP